MAQPAVVHADPNDAAPTPAGATVRLVLDVGLIRRLVKLPAPAHLAGTAGGAGELWFVLTGAGVLDRLDGAAGLELRPDQGLWLPPGTPYRVTAAGTGELRLDIVTLSAAADPAATSAGSSGAVLRELGDCEVETTGDRHFRVLFGPGRDCPAATQFVGEIPPGRAPEHSHPYDEVVLILDGVGVAHLGSDIHALAPGSCVHLPPGVQHCLENTGHTAMRVLGVFHPADSPAAKVTTGRA